MPKRMTLIRSTITSTRVCVPLITSLVVEVEEKMQTAEHMISVSTIIQTTLSPLRPSKKFHILLFCAILRLTVYRFLTAALNCSPRSS